MILHPLQPVTVYVVELERAAAALEASEQATPRLAPDEIARFNHKAEARGKDDARLWRAAHIALRLALERAAGPAVRGVSYDIEPGGRPRVSRALGISSAPHFSLAHAGSVALIALSQIGPVGVDIEGPRTVTVSGERRQRVVCAAKRLAPTADLPIEPDAEFLQAWVRLEAVAKATGLGIGRILTEAGIVGGAREATTAPGCAVRDLEAGRGRFAAVAAFELPPVLAVRAFPEQEADLAAFAS